MSQNDFDPFESFKGDRTVIKPAAGRGADAAGRQPPGPESPQGGAGAPAGPAGGGQREVPMALDAMMATGLNPLVAAAMPLLVAAPRIRHTARHSNPAVLRDSLGEGIRKFEAQARLQGIPNEQVIAGRYVLCTLLDESAASTPWGGAGAWASQSLLVQFHNEAWGGEKVFQLMSKLAENVQTNRNLLELLYVVLAFGFEGRYRVLDNGRAQLDAVRQRLAQMLGQGRTTEKALSPRWQGHPETGDRVREGLPLWVLASLVALALALVFVGLRFSLTARADPVFAGLQALDAKAVRVAADAPPAPVLKPAVAPSPRLAVLLKPEIDAGLVRVSDLADRSVVTIKGDGFFDPGSAEVAGAVRSLLPKIAKALGTLQGQVLVTGHTDNEPIRTVRFPSNWHLSQARADTVRTELLQGLPPNRVRAEGRAESEGVADNATASGRSQNRRVEITLFVAPAA